MPEIRITEMTFSHYSAVLDLMRRTPGVTVRDADLPEATEKYLARNPGLSFIAEEEGRIVGCAMCGHDGRRGYLQHVIVDPDSRGKGLAHRLVERCLDKLQCLGIFKTHIDVLTTNDVANEYWPRRGWKLRDDIYRYSFNRSESENV